MAQATPRRLHPLRDTVAGTLVTSARMLPNDDLFGRIVMQKDRALATIAAREKELRELDVARLSLFGAILHRGIRESEEVWALVEFAKPAGLFEYVGVKQLLEEVLGRPVGLYTEDVLDPRDREKVLNEAVRAA